MRSRLLYVTVVVAAVLLVVGFAVLYLGETEADANIATYRLRQGLPPREGFDRRTLAVAGYAAGAVLSLLVIVLMERWWSTGRERLRRALGLALMAGVALGLGLAVDGLLSLTPTDVLEDLVPRWTAPLSIVQGLAMVAVFGLAVVTLPGPPAGSTGHAPPT